MKPQVIVIGMAAALVLVLLPGAAAAAGRVDRSRQPVPGPNAPVPTPKVVKATLRNGLPVWVVTRRELPVVNAVLQVRAGSAMDGRQPGIAAMTATLLDEGTARRSSLQLAEALDFLGATLSISSSVEYTSLSLRTLTKHLDAALDLMAEIVAQPSFAADELERERKARLQSLKQQNDVASAVAEKVFSRVVYGEDHPYGRPPQGTPASVQAITREDVSGFYERFYRPNNAVLIVVGDVTAERIVPRLEQALAAWTAAGVPPEAAAVPVRPAARPTGVFLVDKPKAAQSEIRIGHPGTARTADPDYYALQVLNTALGGQFTSRINLNLRERHGYTYGVRSSWSFRRGDGPFVAGGGVFTAKSDSALVELLRELRDIRGPRPLSDEEVTFARNVLVRGYPRRFETPEGTAGVLGELALFGLPDSEISNFVAQIAKVKPGDAARVASRYISPEHMAIVVVGDLATIRPGIESLGLGPVTVVDPDGKPMAAQ